MSSSFSRTMLGLAAEFAVASELCRQDLYAQLTLGHQKRTDILLLSEAGEFARIEVKAKRGSAWPGCKGVSGRNAFLVFVDYQRRQPGERPDFFVLSAKDWERVLDNRVKVLRKQDPNIQINVNNGVLVFPNQKGKSGRPREGTNIYPDDIKRYKDKWSTVRSAIATDRKRSEPTSRRRVAAPAQR